MFFNNNFNLKLDYYCRVCRTNEETDVDCDMPEVQPRDDDTDLESFEREEKRMEEEAAKVGLFS